MDRNGKKRWKRAVICGLLGLLLSGIMTGVGFLMPYVRAKADISLTRLTENESPSVLLAYDPASRATRTGKLHPAPAATLADYTPRIYTPYEEIPPDLIHAFVSI